MAKICYISSEQGRPVTCTVHTTDPFHTSCLGGLIMVPKFSDKIKNCAHLIDLSRLHRILYKQPLEDISN